MNVSEECLRLYLQTFLSTLEDTASSFLPPDVKNNIIHLSVLPARVIGYVSTKFGIALEYVRAETTTIEIKRASSRVEDLLLQAPKSFRNTGPTFSVSAANIGFFGISLEGAFPFRLTSNMASLVLKDVQVKLGDWERRIDYAEISGNRLLENWSREKAVGRAKDDVLAALVELNRSKDRNVSLSDYVARYKEKTVLVLGDYDAAGKMRLRAIAEALSSLGYGPLLLDEIPDNPYQDLSQKLTAIGAIARFIMIDDTSKSGHLVEVPICRSNFWVTVLLRASEMGSSWMTAGLSSTSNVILEKAYDSTVPLPAITEAVNWAEQKLEEVRGKLSSTYPWRKFQ